MGTAGSRQSGRGVYVGRRDELTAIEDALAAAAGGAPQIVVVEGEAGIGKTALLRRARERAAGFVVLAASGEEAESTLELGVLAQLTASAPGAGEREPDSSPALIAGAVAAGPFASGAALLARLDALQDDGPALIVIDDAQWIDAASAAAILFALRRLAADRVCVLIATRPGASERAGPGWARLLQDGERVRRVTLTGLDARDVGALAGSLLDAPLTPAAAERLRAHTDGHPLYIRSLVHELPRDALTFDDGPLPAPHSFAATVLAQLAGLSSAAQDLVAATAAAGRRCSLELASAVAAIDDPLGPLDEALAAGVLVLTPGRAPAEIGFVHPLTRAAVHDDLSLRRRRALHESLAARTTGATALRHRVAASPGGDDALAAQLAAAAAAEIDRGRLAAAVEHLLVASRVAADRRVGERALLEAVELLGLSGDVARARALREAVLACADSARRGFALACLAASDGRLGEAVEALLAVRERADLADDPDLEGRLHASLAIICGFAGRGEEAVRWAQRALADPHAPPMVERTARQALGLGLAWCSRGPDGVAALAAPDASASASAPLEADLVAMRGALRVQTGDLRGAVEDLSAVIRWSRAGSAPRSLPTAYGSLAEAEYRLGRWQDALAHADLAVSLARDSDQVWELAFGHGVAVLLHAGRGDWERADEQAAAAAGAAQRAPLPLAIFYAELARVQLAWVRDEPDAALHGLRALWARFPDQAAATLRRRTWEIEADALLRTGRPAEARDLIETIGAERARPPAEVELVALWRLRGAAAQADGSAAEAREAFEHGRRAADRAGSPFAQATLALAHGAFLRRTARRSAATARLRAARELFHRLQARPFVQRCDAELSACGVRVVDDGRPDLGLSPREAAVAGLVAAGRSNREAGAELYLSTKAIEYHLGNIFAKLGIRSRHELAARMAGERSGRPDADPTAADPPVAGAAVRR